MTATLYNYIRTELIKQGKNEYVTDAGDLVFFDESAQFMTKIFSYDADVSAIVNKLFMNFGLDDLTHDEHFKKGFLYRFINRQINRQTIEGFKLQLLATFQTHRRFVNSVYADMEKYILQEQDNTQVNNQVSDNRTTGDSFTDNRSAFSNLPQNNVQLDVNSTVMTTASDNTVSRNKQVNTQAVTGTSDGTTISSSKGYKLDELLKSNGVEQRIYEEFDRACFMQVW